MEPQKPAVGVLKTNDWGDCKHYLVSCSCGDSDDAIRVEVEADDTGIVTHIWTTVKTNWWDDRWRQRYDIDNAFLQDLHWFGLDLVNGLYQRIKLTWRLWTRGYLEYESWTHMDQQQTVNFAQTLIDAADDVSKFRKATAKEKR